MMYLIVCLIVFTSGYVGNLIYNKYKNRVLFYEKIIKFADFLILNIYHLNEDIGAIIDKFTLSLDKKTAEDFKCIEEHIIADDIGLDTVSKLNMCADLNNNEKTQVFEFLKNIGKTNTESQIHIIQNYKAIFENALQTANIDKKQKGSIAMKVSVSIGVVICILII